MFKKMQNRKGFTLIEMLVVIAIIAVLVSVIIPVVSGSSDKAAAATNAANLRGVEGEVITMMLMDPMAFGDQQDKSNAIATEQDRINTEQGRIDNEQVRVDNEQIRIDGVTADLDQQQANFDKALADYNTAKAEADRLYTEWQTKAAEYQTKLTEYNDALAYLNSLISHDGCKNPSGSYLVWGNHTAACTAAKALVKTAEVAVEVADAALEDAQSDEGIAKQAYNTALAAADAAKATYEQYQQGNIDTGREINANDQTKLDQDVAQLETDRTQLATDIDALSSAIYNLNHFVAVDGYITLDNGTVLEAPASKKVNLDPVVIDKGVEMIVYVDTQTYQAYAIYPTNATGTTGYQAEDFASVANPE